MVLIVVTLVFGARLSGRLSHEPGEDGQVRKPQTMSVVAQTVTENF